MSHQTNDEIRLTAHNIGGIDHTELAFHEGVNVLSGENATNRTSTLQAIAAALGSKNVTVKADAEVGEAQLEINGDTFDRTIKRTNGTHHFTGAPYTDRASLIDLFVFLSESNRARQAVVQGTNLRDVIMEPVDSEEIQAEIQRLSSEKDRLTRRRDELDALRDKAVDLEQRRQDVEAELEDAEAELADLNDRIEAVELDPEEARAEESKVEELLDQLNERSSKKQQLEFELSSHRESIESLKEEREEVNTRLAEVGSDDDATLSTLQSEIDELRETKSELETTISQLRNLLQFNRGMLGQSEAVVDLLDGTESPGELTDALVADQESTVCWTCGSPIEVADVESTIEQVEEQLEEQVTRRKEVEAQIDQLSRRIDDIREHRKQRESLQRRWDTIDDEISAREQSCEELRSRLDQLEEDIQALEAELEDHREERDSEVLDLHEQRGQVELRIERLHDQRDQIASDLEDIEERLEDDSRLDERIQDIDDRIESERTKIERLEDQAIETFNEHMDALLEILGFENIERIWIEKTDVGNSSGRDQDPGTDFELHIVRDTADGEVYWDTVDHLSESERVVTSIMFAISGFLAHDVHQEAPFLLLDSLEAIDASRIARLIRYLEEHTEFLVVALLSEDAAALPEEYDYIEC